MSELCKYTGKECPTPKKECIACLKRTKWCVALPQRKEDKPEDKK